MGKGFIYIMTNPALKDMVKIGYATDVESRRKQLSTTALIRKQLESVLSWKIGIETDFSVSVGKSAKYMYKWLSKEEYDAYLSTYFMGTVEDGWRAVFAMTELFSAVAPGVAEKLGYEYSFEEKQSCMEFLEHVRNMPEDADEF